MVGWLFIYLFIFRFINLIHIQFLHFFSQNTIFYKWGQKVEHLCWKWRQDCQAHTNQGPCLFLGVAQIISNSSRSTVHSVKTTYTGLTENCQDTSTSSPQNHGATPLTGTLIGLGDVYIHLHFSFQFRTGLHQRPVGQWVAPRAIQRLGKSMSGRIALFCREGWIEERKEALWCLWKSLKSFRKEMS